MIKTHCFEKAWIDAFKAQEKYRRLNPPVLEKMINALYLLQLLKKNDFNFTPFSKHSGSSPRFPRICQINCWL